MPEARARTVSEAGIYLNEVQAVELSGSAEVPDGAAPHEAMMISSLAEALHHSALEAASSQSPTARLAEDKAIVGTLDSACNRTCAGALWLERYLKALDRAPRHVRELVRTVQENESFRFGNGGVTPSFERWRLPAILNDVLFLFWVSIVPVASLGLLLGRDCLEAIGAVIDFEAKSLQCRRLFDGAVKLAQMKAGHFMVPFLPDEGSSSWGELTKGRFRKIGLDGVVELAMPNRQWLAHLLSPPISPSSSAPSSPSSATPSTRLPKEHFLTEASLQAARHIMEVHESTPLTSARASSLARASSAAASSSSPDGRRLSLWRSSLRSQGRAMASDVSTPRGKSRVARPRHLAVAAATALVALCAATLPFGVYGGSLEGPSLSPGPDEIDAGYLVKQRILHGRQPLGRRVASESSRSPTGLLGGPALGRHACGQAWERSCQDGPRCCSCRSATRSRKDGGSDESTGSGPTNDWAAWGIAR